MRKRRKFERFIEFLLFGLVLGIIEDVIAVKLVTGESFSLRMLAILIVVTVPFAAFSELIVDSDEYRITEWLVEKIREKF